VVPVFGDGSELDELTRRVSATLDSVGRTWELILVNDGGAPAAWDRVLSLANRWPGVRGIDLQRNFGQHNALLAGIRASIGDSVVTMDDDLQHPPEEIPRLLERLARFDVVYGTPVERVRGWTRDVAAALSKAALATVLGAAHARNIGAFRAFRGSLRRIFVEYEGTYVSIDVLLSWVTTHIDAVPVRYEPRRRGRSGYSLWRLGSLTISMITGFSVWPLRLASIIGLTFAAFGALVLTFVVARYLTAGVTVPGFAFLASVIAIFAGAQLFSLGIIGEYLARMYFRALARPPYVIRTTVNLEAHARV
jgi:undecaprenyl-phosphate 4-deoxy-4-formamido-L-arabinose transferase